MRVKRFIFDQQALDALKDMRAWGGYPNDEEAIRDALNRRHAELRMQVEDRKLAGGPITPVQIKPVSEFGK